jgi:hypothetical protein
MNALCAFLALIILKTLKANLPPIQQSIEVF